jgi:hypothetical protein
MKKMSEEDLEDYLAAMEAQEAAPDFLVETLEREQLQEPEQWEKLMLFD